MTIASVDQAYSAASQGLVQERTYRKDIGATLATTDPPISLWRMAGGTPGAGAFSGTKTGNQITNAVAGALGFANPSGSNVLQLQAAGGRVLTTTITSGDEVNLVLLDRLVDYCNIPANVNTLQTLTNGSSPMLPRYQDAFDVQIAAVAQTALGTFGGTSTCTVTFVDQDGNVQTTTFVITQSAAADRICHGADYFIPLGGAFKGVKQVNSVQLNNALTTGTYIIMVFRVLAILPLKRFYQPASFLFGSGKVLPRLFNGAALDAILVPANTSALATAGVSLNLASLEG